MRLLEPAPFWRILCIAAKVSLCPNRTVLLLSLLSLCHAVGAEGLRSEGLAVAFMVLGSSQVSSVPFSLTSTEPLFPESRLGCSIEK